MGSNRRSKRISQLNTSNSSILTGSLLVRSNNSIQNRSLNKSQSKIRNADYQTPVKRPPSPSKKVSFSPKSVVVDGAGIRSATPTAGLQGTLTENLDDTLILTPDFDNSKKDSRRPNAVGRMPTRGVIKKLNYNDTSAMNQSELSMINVEEELDVVNASQTDLELEASKSHRRFRDSMFAADYTIHEDYIMSPQSWIAFIIILIILSFIVLSLVFPHLFTIKVDHREKDYAVHWTDNRGIFILAFCGCLLTAVTMGCCCGCFSWMVTYFDSLDPGIVPPTPLSPQPIRTMSTHTFHFGYLMSVINGIAMFAATIWYMSDLYLV